MKNKYHFIKQIRFFMYLLLARQNITVCNMYILCYVISIRNLTPCYNHSIKKNKKISQAQETVKCRYFKTYACYAFKQLFCGPEDVPLLRVMQIAPVSLKPLIFCQTMSGKNAIFSQGTLHKLYSLLTDFAQFHKVTRLVLPKLVYHIRDKFSHTLSHTI